MIVEILGLKGGLQKNNGFFSLCIVLYNRPAKNFWVVTPQTSLKFLGQNLFGDQFWGQSEARKMWPRGYFRSKGNPLSAP